MDWGVWPPDNDDSTKGDYQVSSWAAEQTPALGGVHRVFTYDRQTDEAIWEGTVVRRGDPIP